jgi:thiamine-phosphate pyrophosphorylase
VVLNKPFFKDIRDLTLAARKIVLSGGRIIQYRDKGSDKRYILKTSLALKKHLIRTKSIFLVNDHVDIAMLSGADGLHLGQSDLPLPAARKLLGREKIIGVSCFNLEQALLAQEQGADYLGVGPVFATSTKPEVQPLGLKLLSSIAKNIKIPVFAIGGINQANVNKVLSSGASGVAVSSAICTAPVLSEATRSLILKLNS